jgi:hypothetical protein
MQARKEENSKLLMPPTPLARQLVRYILGFGIGVSLGLAPYFGEANMALFKPMRLIPDSLRDSVLPLSAALMGIIALIVQWYGSQRLSQEWFKRVFKRAALFAVTSLVAFIVIHAFLVTTVPILAGRDSVSFAVGLSRPEGKPCQGLSDAECIKILSFDETAIASYWGDRQIQLSKLVLTLSYLSFTSSFGMLVGLIVLRRSSTVKRPR